MNGGNRADLTVSYSQPASEQHGIFPVSEDNSPPASDSGITSSVAMETAQNGRTLPHHCGWGRALAPLLLALVFWLDRLSPEGVAVGALYVAPALLFIRSGRFWEPLLVAAAASLLTVADFVGLSGHDSAIARINVPLELLIVWVTAGVVAYHRVTSNRWSERNARKQATLEQANSRLEELDRKSVV